MSCLAASVQPHGASQSSAAVGLSDEGDMLELAAAILPRATAIRVPRSRRLSATSA